MVVVGAAVELVFAVVVGATAVVRVFLAVVVVIDAAVAPDATMDVFARMVVDVISVALI
jgi:hypothetical protein